MRKQRLVALLLLFACLTACGCGGTSTPTSQDPIQPTSPPPRPAVTWVESDIEHEGVRISLGHRGEEPVVAIERDGKPVANAMVFCTPLSAEGEPAGDEVATTYESGAGKAAPLYATCPWQRPASGPAPVRFRVVLPESEQDWTRDVELPPQ